MSFHALIFDFVFIIAFSVSRLLTKLNFIPLLTSHTYNNNEEVNKN